jgi:hypothetical protein
VQAHRISLVGLAALSLITLPAGACPLEKGKVSAYAPTDLGGATIRKVVRGEQMAVACDGVDLAGSDVRVVFSFSEAGAKQLGYKGVLATEQTNDDGRVQIRVPDAPNLANHTMSVKVFVMDGDTATPCDAGKVRIS